MTDSYGVAMSHTDLIFTAQECQQAKETADKFARAFGEEVRAARQRRGLKQDALAAALQSCGFPGSQSYLSRLESGQRTEPSVQMIVALSVLLNISIEAILQRLRDEGLT